MTPRAAPVAAASLPLCQVGIYLLVARVDELGFGVGDERRLTNAAVKVVRLWRCGDGERGYQTCACKQEDCCREECHFY